MIHLNQVGGKHWSAVFQQIVQSRVEHIANKSEGMVGLRSDERALL